MAAGFDAKAHPQTVPVEGSAATDYANKGNAMSYRDIDKQREYQRKWIAARREAFFADKVCVQCGSGEHLELDHIDPSAKERRGDHALWSWSEERRNAELAKCQVLCTECHKAKTKAMYPPRQHGTALMYSKERCRCQPCRDAVAAKRREYRGRTGKR